VTGDGGTHPNDRGLTVLLLLALIAVAALSVPLAILELMSVAACDLQCDYPLLDAVHRSVIAQALTVPTVCIGASWWSVRRGRRSWPIPVVGLLIMFAGMLLAAYLIRVGTS